jgi:hypothetical protein
MKTRVRLLNFSKRELKEKKKKKQSLRKPEKKKTGPLKKNIISIPSHVC